jgi:ATP-dependent Lhr-like helicase
MQKTKGYQQIISWLKADKRKPFDFQKDTWEYYLQG